MQRGRDDRQRAPKRIKHGAGGNLGLSVSTYQKLGEGVDNQRQGAIEQVLGMTIHKNQRGFSLIEAAIVLGVVGLVIGGIWWGALRVRQIHRVNQMANGIMTIYCNTQRIFNRNSVPDHTDLANTAGWNMGIFSGADGFHLAGNEIALPWGSTGAIQVEYWNKPTYQGIYFYATGYGETDFEGFCEQLWAAMALRLKGQENKVKRLYVDGVGTFWPNFSTHPSGPDWCVSFELTLAF